ncbi:BTAD domain-containing putative transcriptional regulator [Streptomyces sp. NPDC088789]|uniref:AfsR/SARP family transcriptional regulator n=1 Tax=Streptomyces sp. NPDC088789 TaxID=3365899 RepID=UPI00380A4E84
MSHPATGFRVLGPLEVRIGGRAVSLTGRQRALCAALLLRSGHVVSVDRLIRDVWDGEPPAAGAARVRALVAEVRRALGPEGTGLLVTRNPGYSLRATPEQVDLLEFEALVKGGSRAGAGRDWRVAYERHDRALSLWRGEPLSDLPAADAERQRLSELRVVALEGRAEAQIASGQHRDAIAELLGLTRKHPLRERPHALLLRALHADGRTAEALERYAALRRRVVDELGVEPSNELRDLHRSLLHDGGARRPPAAPPGRAEDPRVTPHVPRQLPRPPRRFVGRARETGLLDGCRRNAETLAVIVGPAGVGKTALALHWAHRAADHFPDGQLFLDLRGFDRAEPMTPDEALPLLLQGLGCAPKDIPLGLDAQSALYRTLLVDRRVLVVLDDVADAAHVRPLLPAAEGSLTLVTSRYRLNGLVTLDGAYRVTCDVLESGEALELISGAVGSDVVGADPDTAARLVEMCDRLPLALCAASSWIGDRPGSMKKYVSELSDRGRLARLHVEGEDSVAVRAALDLSYSGLSAEARHAFRCLGLLPGTGRSISAVAATARLSTAETEELIRQAHRVHLVRDLDAGRLTWHDLAHEYAWHRALADGDAAERRAAVERTLDHYLQSVMNTARVCGHHVPRPAPDPVAGSVPREFTTSEEAYAWFDAEWEDISAAIAHAAEHGPARFSWQIVQAAQDLFHHRRPLSEWIRLAGVGLAAAEREGDVAGQAAMWLSTGHARWRHGDLRTALTWYERGEELARRADWPLGEAAGLQGKGVSLKLLGRPREALPCYLRATALYRMLGMRRSEAIMQINTASLNLALGRFTEAEQAVSEAMALADDGNQFPSLALAYLSLVRQKQARWAEAEAAGRESLSMSRATGSLYAQAIALEALGRTRADAGQDERAVRTYEEALAVAEQVENRHGQVDCLVGLTSLALRAGRTETAVRHLDAAQVIAERTGHRAGWVEILLEQSKIKSALGEHDDAVVPLRHAAQLATDGSPLMMPRVHLATALALLHTGEHTEALASAQRAVDLARETGQRLVLAQALTALADIQGAAGDPTPVPAARREAESLYEEIGTLRPHRTAATRPGPRRDGVPAG